MPTRLVTGDGSATELPSILQECSLPSGRILIVADRDVHSLELTKLPIKSLAEAGYDVTVFSEIAGEPDIHTVTALADTARTDQCAAVIGIGGGSAMDLAKLAAAFATNHGDIHEYLGMVQFPASPLPIILVPTTAGTGSEATRISMLSVEKRKVIVGSTQLIPTAAVLDATLTMSLPPRITASTGIDALSHAVEALLSTNASPATDAAAYSSINTISRWLPEAYENGQNREARRAMLFAAYQAGVSLNAGVVAGHSIAYTIANRTGLPHGVTCAMALPYCTAFNLVAARETLERIARHVHGIQDPAADVLVAWLADLNRTLGIPASLREVGIQQHDIDAMVDECIERYPRPNNPAPLERDTLHRLYCSLHEGDIGGYAQEILRSQVA